MSKLILLVIVSYLIGSIPTAYITSKIKKHSDIRKEGSGNMGAANVLIVIGPLFGAIVYVVDLLKGLFPVLMARNTLGTPLSMGLCGMAAILGHDFPIYVGFNGGKGVATTTGVIFGINSIIAWSIYPFWMLFVLLTDQFILSSLLCMLIIPGLMFIFGQSPVFIVFGFIYLLIGIFSHRNDIVEIVSGSKKSARESIAKYIKK